MQDQYSTDVLFTPLRVGAAETRNRIMCLPHGAGFVKDGYVTDDYVEYLGRFARTTTGLVALGGADVHETTWDGPSTVRLWDAAGIPSLARLADAVHDGGSLMIAQLLHLGREMHPSRLGMRTWAPSPIASPSIGEVPHEITLDDLAELRSHYVVSGQNTIEAGFDGVELHAAHGYLLQQFLSPDTNKRTDAYGGDLEGRSRFIHEILQELREHVDAKIIGIRISAGEDIDGGLEWNDVVATIKSITDKKLVDYINLAVAGESKKYLKDASFPAGGLAVRTAELKEFLVDSGDRLATDRRSRRGRSDRRIRAGGHRRDGAAPDR